MKNGNLSVLQKLTTSLEAKKFGTFDDEQLDLSRDFLKGSVSPSRILDFANFLVDEYPYYYLELEDRNARKLFAFAMAQCWLFTRTAGQNISDFTFRNCFSSPLSTLISLKYKLVIDEVEIIEKLTNKKANTLIYPCESKRIVDYSKRFTKWAFLRELKDASISELKTLILIANAMSKQNGLLEYSRISGDPLFAEGIKHLRKHDLLETEVPKEELLLLFPLKKIKKFAREQGVKITASRKADYICQVIEQCNRKETLSFVGSLLADPWYGYSKEHFMKPTIPNAKIFQDYVKNELNRLALYLEYISCIKYKNKTIIAPIPKRTQSGNRPGDAYQEETYRKNVDKHNNKKAFSSKDFISSVSAGDLKKIKKYWNDHCDILVSNVISNFPKSFPNRQLISEVISYWDNIGLLDTYKDEIQNTVYENHWYSLLSSYASYQLGMNEWYRLKNKKQSCSGCGQVFREWSIPIEYALKTDKKIEFCAFCYSYIFNHRFRANTTKAYHMQKNRMQDCLSNLSKALGFIPTRKYMENIELPTQSSEKLIEVGKILLKMPAYDIYIEKFGTWFNCLQLAGVLADGLRKTGFGYQCLANDGHLCLSLGEKAVDDWLSGHNLAHEKESFYPYDEILNPNRLFRTDWKIGNTFIEYAGMMDDVAYRRKMSNKRKLAENNNIKLIVIKPSDLLQLDVKLKDLIS